jgi:predicted DNA-binding WGR domain protein
MSATVQRAPPVSLPAVVGFQQFTRFERVDPATHCARFYLLSVQPTLLGDVALVRTWGRIGTSGTRRRTSFPSRSHAQTSVERLIRRRMRRRYELSDWT